MEDDDEFGDLYTDVLRHNQIPPLLPAVQKPLSIPFPATVAVDGGVEEDTILSRSSLLPASVPEPSSIDHERKLTADEDDDDDDDDDWLLGRDPPPVEEPVNWVDDDEGLIVDEASRDDVLGGFPNKGVGPRVLDMEDVKSSGRVSRDEIDGIEGGGLVEKALEICDPEDEPVIPGLSGAMATSKVPNGGFVKASDSDDWDSGSEDDLQIVLNDTGHDMRGAEGGIGGGSDEDDEDLVIITDDQHHHHQAMEDQDWGDDGVQSTVDGEKKEMLEGAKASSLAPTASGAGLGYSSHGFHPQHHSMFKYVRPGTTPAPRGPGMVAAGALGQARPPVFGPLAGRGRGDWRPAGSSGFPNMQKGFHTGYGLPAWGNGMAGRSFGGGLDFCLPSHKTVFDIDIESFEEKPWRHPGVDISDFFNFGLDEEHWKEYCKQVEQLRLESTMQSKIRVYECGRSEQDYDPDLPPELAAATVHNNMSTENINHGKSENVLTGLPEQNGASASNRPTLPTGRAIQVESGYGERLPSIDTRAPRIRDSDAVIEIVLQDNLDDSRNSNGAFERLDSNLERENQNVFHEQDERPTESKYYGHFPRSSNAQQREAMAFRIPISAEEDSIMPLPSEVSCPSSPKSRSPVDTAKTFGMQHGGRLLQRTSQGKHSTVSERFSETHRPNRNLHLDKHEDLHKEKSSDVVESNRGPDISPSNVVEITRELSTEPKDVEHDDRLTLGDSHEGDGEEASDFRLSSETGGEDGFISSTNRKRLSSCVEQYGAQDNGFGDDSRRTNSDNSRARSGNSRDYRKTNEPGEEVMQVHSSKQTGVLRKHPEKDDRRRRDDYGKDGRREAVRNRSRGRESMHDSSSVHTFRGRTDGFDREMDDSISAWHRREDDTRNSQQTKDRSKVRMTDKKEKTEERGDWIGHGRVDGVRHKDRKDIMINRQENLEDGEMKRKRDVETKRERADKEESLHGYRAREDSHRRRRVREEIVDHRKREDEGRTKGNKHKDDNWHQRDREDRHQLNQVRDDTVPVHGREDRRFASRSKILAGSGRSKEDLKPAGPDKTYHDKDRRQRHGEQSKRSDRTAEETEPLNKARGDTHNREKHFGTEKRSLRNERLSTRPDRPLGASDEQQGQKERHRESNRKVVESEPAGHKREASGKRKRGDHNTQRTELSSKGLREQQSSKHSTAEGKKANGNAGIPASDDESEDSRRGRSKLERWTSHKERDYTTVDANIQPSSIIIREVVDSREEVDEPLLVSDPAKADSPETNADDPLHKAGEDADRHLDTVAKLKMRSERFKLPMPGEKEKDLPGGNRKADSESPACIQNEAASSALADADVKLERPARKRKWTGS